MNGEGIQSHGRKIFSRQFLAGFLLLLGILGLLTGYLWVEILSRKILLPVSEMRPADHVHEHAFKFEHPRKILVLNSYHSGYSWSDNEMSGIVETLQHIAPSIEPVIEFLDCKRFPGMEQFPRLVELFKSKYTDDSIDVIITADNPALEFALRYRDTLFPGLPIVFCGINGFEQSRIANIPNVTGVAEFLDAESTLELALNLQPLTRNVLVAFDRSITGLSTYRDTTVQLKRFDSRVRIEYLDDMPMKDLLARLERASSDTIVLALSYSVDKAGTVFDHHESAELMGRRSSVPVYAMHEERVGHGVVGGRVIGGFSQGKRAVELALDILQGKPPASLPVDLKSPSTWLFDYAVMQRFGLPVDRLPSDAILLNRPVTFFEEHRKIVFATAGLIALLALGIAVLLLNIIRRRFAEYALADSEYKFRTLFETAADMIFLIAPTGEIGQANARACAALNLRHADIEGRNIREFLDPAQADAIMAKVEISAGSGQAAFETTLMRSAEVQTPIDVVCSPFSFEGRKTVIFTARDLSERQKAEAAAKKLQEDLSQSQKLESIGFLAGGIAHDFNNILMSIIGYAELSSTLAKDDSRLKEYLKNIKSAAAKAARLTSQLLAFSRKQALHVKPLALRIVIREIQPILKSILREDIELVIREEGPVKNVLADRTQIEQIIMNLVVNARDAMPDGGRLTIETRSVVVTPEMVQTHRLLRSGEFVTLTVTDTGVGIPENIQSKIFEPFFTTKQPGKGTGLGLSTVYGIVKQHGGHVDLTSETGKGSSFIVFLPTTMEDTPHPTAPLQKEFRGKGTILVVDDDQTIGKLLSDALQPLGYSILLAPGPREAVELSDQHQDRIDVLLTDVIMPEMNGRKLAEILAPTRPGMKIVYMSGYTDDIIARHGIIDDNVMLLHKPVSPMELAEKLRAIMG